MLALTLTDTDNVSNRSALHCRLDGGRAQREQMIGALVRPAAGTQHRSARPARAALIYQSDQARRDPPTSAIAD